LDLEDFRELMAPVTEAIAGKPVDEGLAAVLERRFPPGGEALRAIEAACHAAIAGGWMCREGGAGRRFGRVIEAAPENGGLSVDVVDLEDIVGPRHRHPRGEICLIMPQSAGARFDGQGAGWKVYAPGSAHHPTVSGGRALVLYLLPGGEIEFTA